MRMFVNKVVFGVEVLYIWLGQSNKISTLYKEIFHARTD